MKLKEKNFKHTLILHLIFVLNFSSCVKETHQKPASLVPFQSLASLPTEGKQIPSDQLNLVRLFFEQEFSRYPEYKLIERSELDKILGELQFQQTGIVNSSQITKIGDLSGADVLLSTMISQVDGQFIVQCKLIDLKGDIKGTATGRSSSMKKIDGAAKGCARRLTGRMQ
jgi:hypothetical protein